MLEKWLKDHGKSRFYLTEVYNRGPNSIRSKAAAMAAVRTLQDHRRIIDLTDGGKSPIEIDGTFRKYAWELAPEIRDGTD